jgi:hypothetical protein
MFREKTLDAAHIQHFFLFAFFGFIQFSVGIQDWRTISAFDFVNIPVKIIRAECAFRLTVKVRHIRNSAQGIAQLGNDFREF